MFVKPELITRSRLIEWAVFAIVAFVTCLYLAFRPIPGLDSPNDTARYLVELVQYCGNITTENLLLNRDISFRIFYSSALPACLADSEEVFLFQVAAYVPLFFLAFSRWKSGTALWAGSLLFSVYGLELMTNALRQGFAMLLFFGAISLIRSRPRRALIIGIVAAAAHTSVLIFLPLLLLLSTSRLSSQRRKIGIVLLLVFTFMAFALLGGSISDLSSRQVELYGFYTAIYAEQLSTAFILFMMLPLYYVYGLRYFFERKSITQAEVAALIYSTLIVLFVMVFFPAITHRLAILAVSLQIFLVTISEHQTTKIGGLALLGMIVHLITMLSISNNYDVLFNG